MIVLACQIHLAQGQDINDGLLIHYELNGNAQDASGNGFHGFVNATPATDRFGNPNGCFYFDGIDDYIDLPNSSALKPPLPVSLSFWVKFTSIKPGVLTTDYAQDIHTGVWVSVNAEGKIAFNYGDGGTANPTSRRTKIGETKLETGKWYHIFGVVRGEFDIDIYINGIKECGVYTGTGNNLKYSSNAGSIGRKDSNPNLPPHYFNGYIDDFYYWNREVDITELYNELITEPSLNFIDFSVPNQIGPTEIDTIQHTINITVPCNSSLILTPTFTISDSTIAYVNGIFQISGISSVDFNSPVEYVLYREINCSVLNVPWLVTIALPTVSDSIANYLTSFKSIAIESQREPAMIDSFSNLITMEVECWANLKALRLDFDLPDNTVLIKDDDRYESGSSFDFSAPLIFDLMNDSICKARTWTIQVNKRTVAAEDVNLKPEYYIPNVITPNHDDKNEYFVIGRELTGFPLTIVNRHGIIVFQTNSYHNDFNGANLAAGVYYYSLNYPCYPELIKGPLYIIK